MLRARIFCLIENSSKKSLLNEASSLHIKINRVKKIKVQLLINIFSSQKKGGADKLTRHPLCESSLRSGINFTCEKETVLVEDFYACLLCDLSAKQENVKPTFHSYKFIFVLFDRSALQCCSSQSMRLQPQQSACMS